MPSCGIDPNDPPPRVPVFLDRPARVLPFRPAVEPPAPPTPPERPEGAGDGG